MNRPSYLNGITAAVRRLHARGWSRWTIMKLYRIGRAEIGAILAPAPRPTRRPGTRREPYTPTEWGTSRGPEYRDDDPVEPQIAAETVPTPAWVSMPPAMMPAPAGDWGNLHGGSGPGGSNPNAAVSDDDAARIRASSRRCLPPGRRPRARRVRRHHHPDHPA